MEQSPGFGLGPVVPTGARCGTHGEPATATCPRCGDFVCHRCDTATNGGVCETCAQRTGAAHFPLNRDNFEVGAAFSLAWERFMAEPLLMVAILIGGAIGILVIQQFVSYSLILVASAIDDALVVVVPLLLLPFNLLLNALHASAHTTVALDVVRARTPGDFRTDTLLAVVLRFVGWGLLASTVMFLVVGVVFVIIAVVFGVAIGASFSDNPEALGAILPALFIAWFVVMIPGTYVGLGLVFVQFELVHDRGCGIFEAISRSWRIADGQRMHIFLGALLAGVLNMLGMIPCFLGLLVTLPTTVAFFAATYLGLRNGLLPAPRDA